MDQWNGARCREDRRFHVGLMRVRMSVAEQSELMIVLLVGCSGLFAQKSTE